MSDVSETYAAIREEGQVKRQHNRASSLGHIQAAGYAHEVKNHGAHIIIREAGHRWDFWPGTGKWVRDLNHKRARRGVRGLMRDVDAWRST